jgi:23S rRNA maturation-related 3'-5' exoribonuclease YhaM
MKRFILKQSDIANHYEIIDQTNGIVIVFESGNFNNTQKITHLKHTDPNDFMHQANQMYEVEQWLIKNHRDKL